jgi:tetratricopeptide (TPR) repeat protein
MGITGVLQMLLKNPTLKPELFENVSEAISKIGESLQNDIFDIKAELKKLTDQNPLEGKLKETFHLLIKEATTHYNRGKDLESGEEYRKSITSLEDALRLIETKDINVELEGAILAFLSGVEVITGFLQKAIEHASRAINILHGKEDSVEHYVFAKGNLAFALYMNQEYKNSKKYFLEILSHFESEGNLLEIVRTLSHLLELETQSGSIDAAFKLLDRIQFACAELDKLLGPTNVTASALGGVANLYAEVGVKLQNKIFLKKAVKLFNIIEDAAKKQDFRRMWLGSRSSRARCLWNLDKLDEAEQLYEEIIIEGKDFLPKVAIDAKFNLALLLIELKQLDKCKKLLTESVKEYEIIGDMPSAQDARNMLKKIKRKYE